MTDNADGEVEAIGEVDVQAVGAVVTDVDAKFGEVEAVGAPVTDLETAKVVAVGSESSSSGSSASSRERKRKRVGAAAATALITSQVPLDVDETEKIVHKELTFPTNFAARLQHEGGTIEIMVDTGVEIQVQPRHLYPDDSVIVIIGTSIAVERAVTQIQSAHASQSQAAIPGDTGPDRLGQVEIPAVHLNAVVGQGESEISKIRKECGGIMIAMMPAETPGGPLTAYVGPGPRKDVDLAETRIRDRLTAAMPSDGGVKPPTSTPVAPVAKEASEPTAPAESLMVSGPPTTAPPEDETFV